MIELLAPDETARLAKALRDSAQELWRRSADLAGAPQRPHQNMNDDSTQI
jgi:hypothetical protein